MLLIHWSRQNNTNDIIKNGIRPKRRKNKDYDENHLKGVWCFPYTRNNTLNNNWKRNLKTWNSINGNYNGFVFKLEDSDFPIYAGDWYVIAQGPKRNTFNSYFDFIEEYGKYFSDKNMQLEEGIDYRHFEIIIPNKIDSGRIVKIIKDRPKINEL
jgi:hypothetical protein